MNERYKTKIYCLLFSLIILFFYNTDADSKEIIELGEWNPVKLNELIDLSNQVKTPQKKIDFISERFLSTPYAENTLTGDIDTDEIFTINLKGMDCFTYIDYVVALNLSKNFKDFKEQLREIRYRPGDVSFTNRNHFFSDWIVFNSDKLNDVTETIGKDKIKRRTKTLNKINDNTVYLPGIPIVKREIKYIPTERIDGSVLDSLKSGDYIGIYTDKPGLDVSHTGIIIKKDDKTYIRHASSRARNMMVVDEELLSYLSHAPGIVVYRTK